MDGIPLGKQIEYVKDENQNLTITQVSTPDFQGFKQHEKDEFNFGVGNTMYWIRFTLLNPTSVDQEIFLESRYSTTEYLTLYMQDRKGGFTSETMGIRVPFQDREIKHRYPTYRRMLPPGETTFYISSKNVGTQRVPLFLWSRNEFQIYRIYDYTFLAFLFGGLLVMFFYNGFIYLSTMSLTYLFYALYILGYCTFTFSLLGLFQQLITPESSTNWFGKTGASIFVDWTNFFAYSFSMQFLNAKIRVPKFWYYTLNTFRVIHIVNIFITIFVSYQLGVKVMFAGSIVMATLLFSTSLIVALQRYHPAYYFLTGWFFLLVGSIVHVLLQIGVFKMSIFTVWIHSTGAVVEVIILSLALGERMNLIYKEREIAFAKLDRERAEKEAAKERVIKVQKENIRTLDAKVFEKTRDIKSMLENIQQGIFTLHEKDDTAVIDPEFSNHLVNILEIEGLAGKTLSEALFNSSSISADNQSLINSVVFSSFNDTMFMYQLNSANLPNEFEKYFENGRKKILEIDWCPVFQPSTDIIQKIMVTLRDVTTLRELQRKSHEQQQELEYISEILNVSDEDFARFIRINRQFLNENRVLVENSQGKDKGVLKILFINMHT
ncbi:MAG: hypothetical protein HQK54_18275, partial [Oligoflexales bacterium]|nr:hypothetical protein [Oligoflexales bacterium]